MKTVVIVLLAIAGCTLAGALEDADLEVHQRMGISEKEIHEIGEEKKLLEGIEEAKAKNEPTGQEVESKEDPNAPHEKSESDPHKEVENVINGDEMVTLDEIKKEIDNQLSSRRRKRQFSVDPNKLWQTDLDYYVDPKFPSSLKTLLKKGVDWFNANTCFILRQVNSKEAARKPYLTYMKGGWCASYVGKITKDTQVVTMTEGCGTVGTIIHETLHALGFHHEQSRNDRDQYVRILLQNIGKRSQYNFNKENTQQFGFPYIFGSVMAYPGKAFSVDYNKQTIVADDRKYQRTMGHRITGSFADSKRINTAYKCIDKCQRGPNCKNGGYRHPKWCNQCLCPEAFTGNDCSQLHPAIDPTGSNHGCGGVVNVPTVETRYVLKAMSGDQEKPHYCITKFQAPPGKVLQIRMSREGDDWMSCVGGCNWGFIELNGGAKTNNGFDYTLPGYRDCCVDQIETRPIAFERNVVMATAFARKTNTKLTVYAAAVNPGSGPAPNTTRRTTLRTTRSTTQRTTRGTTRRPTTSTKQPHCRTADQVRRVNKCLPYCNSNYSNGQSYEWYMRCYNNCFRICA